MIKSKHVSYQLALLWSTTTVCASACKRHKSIGWHKKGTGLPPKHKFESSSLTERKSASSLPIFLFMRCEENTATTEKREISPIIRMNRRPWERQPSNHGPFQNC
ncbi:hypothetical protein CEXT_7591 [Caerostris extrusa]|uniref:Secreted protein n=1 Tax=Caerostris extrusa TaxID=172846 RepID=A0AAV4W3X8_CAEEX|nr:hypothetical protein CEXT_7591 [Caerostris extrusa]